MANLPEPVSPQKGWSDIAPLPTTGQSITIRYAQREIRMITVSESELDEVASANPSIDLAMFGITSGTFVAFVIVLATVDLAANAFLHATFAALAFVSAALMLSFGLRARSAYKSVKRRLRELKRDPSG